MKNFFGRGLLGPLLLFLIFHCPSLGLASLKTEVSALAKERNLSSDKQWLRLLHFRKTWEGTKSDVDGPRFFLAEMGRWDAETELQAFIEQIFNPSQLTAAEDQSVFCRFPVRFDWLKKKFADKNFSWPSRTCPLLQRFRNAVHGPSVSLVFSSYYLNNPSSAFGHTFLRVNKAPAERDGQRYELLDYGFNFAANPTTTSPFLYAILGTFGGFPGTFTSIPYYYKVREYNNHESRDLWQYELSLSEEKVSTLTDHFWELGGTSISYWYLTQNCSFHMLTALEAADPELEITSRLKKYVIPSDTIHAVMETPGLVKAITYRPSIRTQMLTRLELLDSNEKETVEKTVTNRTLKGLSEVPDPARQSLILDATIDLIDFKYSYEVQLPESEITKFKNQILSLRGSNPTISRPLVIPTPVQEEPHKGHPSRRVSSGWRKWEGAEELLLLQHRFAFHDLYDPSVGYPESAQITMFETNFTYSSVRSRLDLDQFTLFEVITRQPWKKLTPNWSWEVHLGSQRMSWDEKPMTSVGLIDAGAGITLAPFDESLFLFGGAKAGARADLEGRTNLIRGSLGPAAGLRWRISPKSALGAEAWWRRERRESNEVDLRELSAHFHYQFLQSWGFRLRTQDLQNLRSGEIQLMKYF